MNGPTPIDPIERIKDLIDKILEICRIGLEGRGAWRDFDQKTNLESINYIVSKLKSLSLEQIPRRDIEDLKNALQKTNDALMAAHLTAQGEGEETRNQRARDIDEAVDTLRAAIEIEPIKSLLKAAPEPK